MDATLAWTTKPTITGSLVTLRPYRDDDLPEILDILADPQLRRLTGSVHSSEAAEHDPVPEEATRRWYESRADQSDRLDLMVVDNASGRCVGEAVLNRWDRDNESCNFRILLGRTGRDRGLGTEATRLLLDHAFARLPLHRISLDVLSTNPRARRAYEKAGFVVEGALRDSFRFDDDRIAEILMSVLRPDWLAGRGSTDHLATTERQ